MKNMQEMPNKTGIWDLLLVSMQFLTFKIFLAF